MFNKKCKLILLLSIILLSFLLITSVSATDNTNITNTSSLNSNQMNNNMSSMLIEDNEVSTVNDDNLGNNNILSQSNYNNDILIGSDSSNVYISPNGADDAEGTVDNPTNWKTAYSNINAGGTIYFTTGTYNIVNQTITKNLTLTSYNNANVIIDTQNKGYIFYIDDYQNNLTLNGLTFVNGTGYVYYKSFTKGGAIFSTGLVNINNSTFINNSAYYGGAIEGGTIYVNESHFINNSGNSGGAINVLKMASVNNSIFINNSAGTNGGAIEASMGSFDVYNSIFINNSAGTNGGALCADYSDINVEDSIFINNSAGEKGGAIVVSHIQVKGSIFINNTGLNAKDIYYSSSCKDSYNWWGNNTPFTGENNGNLIYYENGNQYVPAENWVILTATCTNGIINTVLNYYNTSTGEIKLLPEDITIPARPTIYNVSNIYSNPGNTQISSYYLGSGEDISVTVDNQTLNLTVTHATNINEFYVNASATNTIIDGTLNHPFHNITEAVNAANLAGEVTIYITNGTYTDVNMTVNNNLTLKAYNNENVIINAKGKGYIFYNPNEDTSLTLNGLTLTNGTGFDDGYYIQGGAIYSEGLVIIKNSSFINNTANYSGAIDAGDIIVIDSSFINNHATESIGAISASDVNVTGSIFINNTANRTGVISASNVNVTGSIFINNTANHTGKVISCDSSYYVNYNWWGNNTPFVGENYNELIDYYGYVQADNWVIMDLTSNLNIINLNGNIILTVTLNNVNNTLGVVSTLPDTINLANRTVTFTSTDGSFNPSSTDFNNSIKSTYTPTSTGTFTLTSTIDNQTLTIPVIVNSNTQPKSTSITNNNLISYENGTVNINIIDEDTIVNTGSVNLFYNNKAIGTGYVHNGQVTIKLNNLKPGNYSIIAFYFGKIPFDSASKSLNLTILANTTNNKTYLTGYNLTKNYNQLANYTGQLTDANGNPITGQHIQLNLTRLKDGASKIYDVTTDTNGEYQLSINLATGSYTAQSYYPGNKNYTSSNTEINSIIVTNNITNTILTANNFQEKVNASENFTGKLQNTNSNPIIGQHIQLNLTRLKDGASKIYDVTTDTNGEYQLQINLAIGNYTAQCSYTGTSQYTPSSANATLTVTK